MDLAALEAAFNTQIEYHASRGHASEVAWAIYALLRLNLRIRDNAASVASHVDSSFVALLLLDAENRGQAQSGIVLSQWAQIMTKSELYGEHWLLCYEANIKGWLPTLGGGEHVSQDISFGELKSRGVEFYDRNRPFPGGGEEPY